MIALSPLATEPGVFFRGGLGATDRRTSSLLMLSSSAFISWVFAKSVANSSKLGAKYGLVGGVQYATWYTSFPCVGLVVWRLRKQGFKSLPEAINARYGNAACLAFFVTVLYRLYQEVWSNAMVVAEFYGEYKSAEWWCAAILSSVVPLAYALLGGLRTSLISDVVQAVLAVGFLVAVLSVVGSRAFDLKVRRPDVCAYGNRTTCDIAGWNPEPGRDRFSLAGGMDLVVVGLLQGCFSYGFMDPVLTDRAFLLEPKKMLIAYTSGGTIAAFFIMFFAYLGVYGNMAATLDPAGVADFYNASIAGGTADANATAAFVADVKKGVPQAVAKSVGTAFFSMVNIVFITSSISTLDSTFTSVSKVMGPEWGGLLLIGRPQTLDDATTNDVNRGRIMMACVALAGLLTLLSDQSELSATTVSGLVVTGLGPPIIGMEFLRTGYRPLAFHMPFWLGVAIGVAYTIGGKYKESVDRSVLSVGDGGYAKLLGWELTSFFATLTTGTASGGLHVRFQMAHQTTKTTKVATSTTMTIQIMLSSPSVAESASETPVAAGRSRIGSAVTSPEPSSTVSGRSSTTSGGGGAAGGGDGGTLGGDGGDGGTPGGDGGTM